MTREEQINEAVETYINGLIEDGIEIPIEDYENIEEGFVAGAKWADNHPINVWHDASEEPTYNHSILYQYKFGRYYFTRKSDAIAFYGNWKNFVEFLSMTHWAYISDLLPKEVRNEND